MAKKVKPVASCIPKGPIYHEIFLSRNFNTAPVTIDGLLGDTYNYTVVMQFDDASADSILDITCNSDTGSNYRNYETKGLSSTGSIAIGNSDTAIELQNIIGTANPSLLLMEITGDSSEERHFDIFYSADGAILKQSSYWKNTASELTQIVLTAASSVTCDSTISVFATLKANHSENWLLLESQSWTSQDIQTTPISFTGLAGDTDKVYKLQCKQDSASNNRILVESNGDGAANYVNESLRNNGLSLTATNFTGNGWDTLQNNEDDRIDTSANLYAESGNKRLLIETSSTPAGGRSQNFNAGWWSNTADEITSLNLVGTSTSLSTGEAKLYKLKNPDTVADIYNLPFKILKSVDVSGDFSAGDTLSFDCDNALMIKIEGSFSTVGNDLRLQLDGDTGPNYIEQYVKGVSSTASAATTTTTFKLLCDASASKVAHFEYYLFPKSGENRPSLLRVGHGEDSLEYKAHWWSNTADEINTIKVFASSTTTCTGTLKYSYIPLPSGSTPTALTLGLNGSTEYLTTANNTEMQLSDGNKTIAMWFKCTPTSQWLFSQGNTAGTDYFDIYLDGNGHPVMRALDNSNSISWSRRYATDMTDGEWHHIICVMDGWGTGVMYIDGSSVSLTSSGSGTITDIAPSTSNFIGCDPDVNGLFMGDLTTFTMLDKNVSAAEAAQLYNNGVALQPWLLPSGLSASLDCALPMNDESSNEFSDYSGNVNDATAQGSAAVDGSSINIVTNTDPGP